VAIALAAIHKTMIAEEVITTIETKKVIQKHIMTEDIKTTDRGITTMVLKIRATIINKIIEEVEVIRMMTTMEPKIDNNSSKRKSISLMSSNLRSLMRIN